MAVLVWPRAYLLHVGDSRAFYLHKGRLKQLTRDQTTGEYMVDAGAWTEEQARKAPTASALVSALGGDDLTVAVGLVDLQPGDVLLLCTDGLTRHVPDERIAEVLGRAADAESACRGAGGRCARGRRKRQHHGGGGAHAGVGSGNGTSDGRHQHVRHLQDRRGPVELPHARPVAGGSAGGAALAGAGRLRLHRERSRSTSTARSRRPAGDT